MLALVLTLLVSWICIRALARPADEQHQAALMALAEEPEQRPSLHDGGSLMA